MKRRDVNRGLLLGMMLGIIFLGACAQSPIVIKPKDQIAIDRKFVEIPPAFDLKPLVANLNAPTAMTFDTDGTLLFAEEIGRAHV